MNIHTTLAARLTHILPCLYFSLSNIQEPDDLALICERFCAQTNLYFVYSGQLTYLELINSFAKLPHLNYLTLEFFSCNYTALDLACPKLWTDLQRLPQLQMLEIEYSSTAHDFLAELDLAWVFPDLRVLYLTCYSHNCSICSYDSASTIPLDTGRVIACAFASLRPLRRCSGLRKVEVNFPIFDDILGPIQDVLLASIKLPPQ